FVAASAGRTNLQGFAGTLPMSSAALATASMKTAARSTAAAWLLVCAAIPLGLSASGTLSLVIDPARDVQHGFGTARTIALAVAACVGLVVWTWKRLAQGLCLGFAGRAWLTKGYALLTLSFLVLLGPLLWLAGDRRVVSAAWDALPWILAALVALK